MNLNQNRNTVYPGYNNMNYNPAITQQPGFYNRRQPTPQKPYDYAWHEKPSQNGEFKYGLCQCCSSPSSCGAICAIICCFIPWPGWCFTSNLNGQVAEVVGGCHVFLFCSTFSDF